jgi:hypothetical protein
MWSGNKYSPRYESNNPLNKIKILCEGGSLECYPPIQMWSVIFMDGEKRNNLYKIEEVEGLTDEDKEAIAKFIELINAISYPTIR